jgi:serine/threonine protein phosphatase PrpC
MRIRGWSATDIGRRRHHNEDSFLCNDELALYAVADGMGGHVGGEEASRMAVEIVSQKVGEASAVGLDQSQPNERAENCEVEPSVVVAEDQLRPPARMLVAAVAEADRAIYERAQVDPSMAGMGTTLTAMLFHERRAYVTHVGDSRAYLYRDGRARQLTEDHSWIADQVRAGILSPDEAKASRFRNIITRSVGFEPAVQPDLYDLMVQAGDCYLLCSDGLSNHVSLDEIGQVLTAQFYRDAPTALIDLANERGGDDNITCVCVYAGND